MSIGTLLLFVTGVVLLWQGAEFLVKGSSRLALWFGIRPLIVGLTIVAMGTSSPELAVSLLSALRETKAIALGTIIGSNIANIGLVLGVTALIHPLDIHLSTIRREMPFLILSSFALFFLSLDHVLSFVDGAVLFFGFIVFILYMVRESTKQRKESLDVPGQNRNAKNPTQIIKNIVYVIIGLAGLIIGSLWIVKSAVVIAGALGVSHMVIAITMVAVGTSLPELAISSVAAFKGQADIAVGNAVGSNIFNTLLVIAVVAMITPIPVATSQLKFEFVVMLIFTCAALPFMWSQFKLNRKEAIVLLTGYLIFVVCLFK
jgi:cation:H+ antiporter